MAKVGEDSSASGAGHPAVCAVLRLLLPFQASARSEAPILREAFRGLARMSAEFLPCEVMVFVVQIPGLYPKQGQRYSPLWSAMSFPSWTLAFALLLSSLGLLRR